MRRGKNRIKDVESNGSKKSGKLIDIPYIQQEEVLIRMIGTSPLMVCNKMNVVADIDEQYGGGGKAKRVNKPKDSPDEAYAKAFYVMPSSKHKAPDPKALYGIPASGIKKCLDAAIRTTGITDNVTIGNISRSFFVMADEGGLCRLRFKRLERDVRAVNIGSMNKTTPQLRHRPMFHGWSVEVLIQYNPMIIGPEQIVNLFNYAGVYIGWGELRAQKKQGECGGFRAEAG